MGGEAVHDMKVASLLPAATEMVCAMGAGGTLVGASHECDHPPGLADLPRLTRSRLELGGLSEKVHESVSALLEGALSIYEVDPERLAALSPDVIITQDLCDVCAVSYDDVCAAVGAMTPRDVQIVRLHPERLEDIYDDVRRIGGAIGVTQGAEDLVAGMRDRMTRLAECAGALPVRTVLLVEWLAPVMVGGLWSADLAEAAGARALASKPGEHARTLDADELAALDPDVVVIKPCGFDLERTREEVSRFAEYFPWGQWRATREESVFIVDGNAYFNRPGPRIVDSAEILAGCVHEAELAAFRRQHAGGVRRVRRDLSLGDVDG